MAKKRRTRKNKINPKRPISVSWKPPSSKAGNSDSEANVKGQLSKSKLINTSKKSTKKFALDTDKNVALASIKKDLLKSLLFASLIVASEVVIYLIWY